MNHSYLVRVALSQNELIYRVVFHSSRAILASPSVERFKTVIKRFLIWGFKQKV